MSGAGVIFDISELRRLEPLVISVFGPPSAQLLTEVATEIESQTRERFRSKQAPSGVGWAPWSESYARSGKGIDLLRRSGALEDSIQSLISGDSIESGSNLEYAARQNYGFEGPDARGRSFAQPPRPFIGFGAESLDDIAGLVTDHYERRFAEAFA